MLIAASETLELPEDGSMSTRAVRMTEAKIKRLDF